MDYRKQGFGGFLYDDLFTLDDHIRYTIKDLKAHKGIDVTEDHIRLMLAARDITISEAITRGDNFRFDAIGQFTQTPYRTDVFDVYVEFLIEFENDRKREPNYAEQLVLWRRAARVFREKVVDDIKLLQKPKYAVSKIQHRLRRKYFKYDFSVTSIDEVNI